MKATYFTGIGSRQTPTSALSQFTQIGRLLAERGFILRSGGAPGADRDFETGCDMVQGPKEIYLPWTSFQNRYPMKDAKNHRYVISAPTAAALELAEKYHPNWAACSMAARKLHARNCHQVLGYDLDKPSRFVLCWTEGGNGGGGTGQAIRIAKDRGIPVLDFGGITHGFEFELNKFLAEIAHA